MVTTYNWVRAVVPENTEVRASDHDYSGTGKIVPSETVDFKTGRNPSESLLSGGVDRNRMIYVAVHDGVFQKYDNYRHVASGILLL